MRAGAPRQCARRSGHCDGIRAVGAVQATRQEGGGADSRRRAAGRLTGFRSLRLVDDLHLHLVHAATVHFDLREGRLDLAKVRGRELNVDGSQVLVQVIDVAGAWDWDNPGLPSEKPRRSAHADSGEMVPDLPRLLHLSSQSAADASRAGCSRCSAEYGSTHVRPPSASPALRGDLTPPPPEAPAPASPPAAPASRSPRARIASSRRRPPRPTRPHPDPPRPPPPGTSARSRPLLTPLLRPTEVVTTRGIPLWRAASRRAFSPPLR